MSVILPQLPAPPRGLFLSVRGQFAIQPMPPLVVSKPASCPRPIHAENRGIPMDFRGNGAVNAYPGAMLGQGAVAGYLEQKPPRTLSSAASRLSALNERLSKAEEALAMICAEIGAISIAREINGTGTGDTPPSGAVYRLNDLADLASEKLSTIESQISSIQRALG